MRHPKKIHFKHHERQLKIPFVIYVHFEALQVPASPSKIIHKPCGFAYSIKCSYDDSQSKYEDFYGEYSQKVLWEKLEFEAKTITEKLLSRVQPQYSRLSKAEQKSFDSITDNLMYCYFCGGQIKRGEKFYDFHKLTGQFLGAAHRNCQLKPKVPCFIPVVMHNLSRYGAHYLLNELTTEELKGVNFVGNDEMIRFGFVRRFQNAFPVRFVDSRRFVNEEIEDFEKILDDSKKYRLRKDFRDRGEFELMKMKSGFPFYYMDSFKKFSNGTLPTKRDFFDQITREDIGDEEYQKVLKIWRAFKCRTIGDYFKLYLKSNVLLLEDIFENFRTLCLKQYRLDPAHYFTLASFAWDSMLRFTNVKLELLRNDEMIEFIKSNIRGGITHCAKRYAKANNIYCEYNKTKPSSFIVYLDANNLGGWAMSQNLPFSDFRWLTTTEIESLWFEIQTLREDSAFGYVLEVDLDYPKQLHKHHNDMPSCAEHLTVPPPPVAPESSSYKPLLNFYPKRNYVIDYRLLQQCLSNGLLLRKIHRVLKYRQGKWLEPFVAYNTKLRTATTCDFEIKLYKFLNNSVCGKTMEKATTDKPIHAGFTILDLQKKFMYDFHYKYMVPKYRDKNNLLYIDTDGIIYEIFTSNFYQDLKSDPDLFDTSNIDKRWGIPTKNRKVIGKMKDESGGKIIREFFGVGAKIYYLEMQGEVKKAVTRKKLVTKNDFEDCVLKGLKIDKTFPDVEAVGHEIQISTVTKTILTPGDKQRLVLEDRVHTLAWGYGN